MYISSQMCNYSLVSRWKIQTALNLTDFSQLIQQEMFKPVYFRFPGQKLFFSCFQAHSEVFPCKYSLLCKTSPELKLFLYKMTSNTNSNNQTLSDLAIKEIITYAGKFLLILIIPKTNHVSTSARHFKCFEYHGKNVGKVGKVVFIDFIEIRGNAYRSIIAFCQIFHPSLNTGATLAKVKLLRFCKHGNALKSMQSNLCFL